MQFLGTYFKQLFFSRRFYTALVFVAFVFVLSFWFPWMFEVGQISFVALVLLVVLDNIALFSRNGIGVHRDAADRFSNGDPNKVQLILVNKYSFKTTVTVIDEVPIQFQQRDFKLALQLKSGEQVTAVYMLRPVERGGVCIPGYTRICQEPAAIRYTPDNC